MEAAVVEKEAVVYFPWGAVIPLMPLHILPTKLSSLLPVLEAGPARDL